jgi:hypothetical protein
MPTVILCLFVVGMATLAYEMIYPVLVKGHFKRLITADLLLTMVTLTIVGMRFWGSDQAFSFGLFDTNWFIATFIAFFAAEALLVPRYCRRFGINLFNPDSGE